MSCINVTYTGEQGLYCEVKPITDVQAPVVTSPEGLEWDPVPSVDFHATVGFDIGARIDRETLEKWLYASRLEKNTTFTAASLGAPQWWENGGKVYLGVELYSTDLFGLHESLKGLGVRSSYPTYKCHLTFGRWRAFPQELILDRLFMNEFVKTMVSVQIPNIIEFSLLNITNAEN